MTTSIRQRLEQDRRDLLDLGLRNTLLNFRELKSSGVRVVDELSEEVHRILVRDERPMSFLPTPEPEDESLQFDEYLFAQPDEAESQAARYTDNQLQTPYSDRVLQRRLLNSYYSARSHLEERGVNVLYMALGMLKWYESAESQEERTAPLLLVPVVLDRKSASTRFQVRYDGSDLGTNTSLSVKLRAEFGLELPELSEGEVVDLESYYRAIERVIANTPRWRVEPNEIHVGFFSFTKLLMYEDLDPERWPEDHQPQDHHLLKALLEEGFGTEAALPSPERQLDQDLDLAGLYQVVDADSSQTLAIQAVLDGRNTVIQGPPGTGKSQTITNLIAEAVAAGKKVLFVAEKMAALEVVKRRLESVGLGDCCVEIHSHKTNKREFVAELGRTMSLTQPADGQRTGIASKLRASRDRLNAYAHAVNAVIGGSGVTPFKAYGRLLAARESLKEFEPPRIDRSALDGVEWNPEEVQARELVVKELESLLRKIGPLQDHPFWGSAADAYVPTFDKREIEEASREAFQLLDTCEQSLVAISEILELPTPNSLQDTKQLLLCARRLTETPKLAGVAIDDEAWVVRADDIQQSVECGKQLVTTRRTFESSLHPSAWGRDVHEARNTIASYGTKWWRFLARGYRRSRRELAELWQGPLPRDYREQLAALDAVLLVRQLEDDLASLAELLIHLYGRPIQAHDWRDAKEVFVYLNRVHREITDRSLPAAMFRLLSGPTELSAVALALDDAEQSVNAYLAALERALAVSKHSALRSEDFRAGEFSFHRKRLESWAREPGRLQEVVVFNHLTNRLQDEGLGFLSAAIESWPQVSNGLLNLFREAYYGQLLAKAMKERPVLASFDGSSHDAVRDEFRSTDRFLLDANRIAVARQHWDGLPQNTGVGQVGVLSHEIQKKRRHRPIRRLLLDAGRAIQAIKPVFMMSPLSIASFIPPNSVNFDLVVFDEASQVRPVDAYGALLRGSQAVVVGDRKQLPPTSFFDAELEQEDDEEAQDRASDVESILGVFESRGAHQVMLKWHYRSRHESLIALSNKEFYENGLTIFPSPDNARESLGLVYHHLPEAHYERGSGRSYNRGEAKVVARAVMAQARRRPDQTLGVAAFSISQMDVILDELEILRREDSSCEPFFTGHPEEPFFVKNLERVQGDERDVIFISVGYGRTAEGYLAMNFGPLNREGGERRLNVLITRARCRCEIFTNLKSDDIDLNRARGRGVVALKNYLRYAEFGILDLPLSSGRDADSDFEAVVADSLRQHGYSIEQQVGSAGFFIDLAVVNPDQPGRYLLGIECDGAAYHSARWARDRDRLRQQILEGLGWTLHRIWSTDWFSNPDRELRRALAAIEKACTMTGGSSSNQRNDESGEVSNFNVPRKEAENEADQQEASLRPYELAKPEVFVGSRDLSEIPAVRIATWVTEVVSIESPVHVQEVVSRVVGAAGHQRAGSRIRAAVESGILHAIKSGYVRRDSDHFLWQPSMTQALPRDRSQLPATSRKLDLVCPAEIEVLLHREAVRSHGASEAELVSAVCRSLGFGRVSAAMNEQIGRCLESLLNAGALMRQGSVLRAVAEELRPGSP